MLRIFQYGFTARKNGHGFGPHSRALLAQSMGGSLCAQSDGPGQGAAFTLELRAPRCPGLAQPRRGGSWLLRALSCLRFSMASVRSRTAVSSVSNSRRTPLSLDR